MPGRQCDDHVANPVRGAEVVTVGPVDGVAGRFPSRTVDLDLGEVAQIPGDRQRHIRERKLDLGSESGQFTLPDRCGDRQRRV